MPARVIRLRYAGTCIECALELPAGTSAWWDAEARSTTCLACRPLTVAEPAPTTTAAPPVPEVSSEPSSEIATGVPGGSALRDYERRYKRSEQRIDDRWRALAPVVKFLSEDPRSTVAWAKGSEGERFLAARLLEFLVSSG